MITCPHCGKPHPDDFNWCPETKLKLDLKQAAEQHIECGKEYYKKGEWSSVINECTEASKLDPNNAFAYVLRAKACLKATKDYDTAMADIAKALRLDPECGEAFVVRGTVYRFHEEYDKAIKDFNQAIELGAVSYHCLRDRACCRLIKKEWHSAISDFSQAINIYKKQDDCNNQEMAALYNIRGYAYQYKNDEKNALEDFENAIKLEPTEKEYKNDLAAAKKYFKGEKK